MRNYRSHSNQVEELLTNKDNLCNYIFLNVGFNIRLHHQRMSGNVR